MYVCVCLSVFKEGSGWKTVEKFIGVIDGSTTSSFKCTLGTKDRRGYEVYPKKSSSTGEMVFLCVVEEW